MDQKGFQMKVRLLIIGKIDSEIMIPGLFFCFCWIWTACSAQNVNMTLNVCSAIEGGNTHLVYDYRRAAAAIEMAVEYCNQITLPPGIKLKFHYKDGGTICAANNLAIKNALDWVKEGVDCHVYIGPGCDRAVADMYTIASYRNVPVIGVPAANVVGSTGLLRSQLPLLIRPAYSFTDVCRLIITFLNIFHFNHTTVLTDESNHFYHEFGDILEAQYRADQERLYNNAKFSYFRSEEITALRYRAILLEASLNARVLVLFANASIVRTLMLHAKDLGMTNGEYVYIAVELFRSNYWGEFTWRFDDRHDRDVQLAFRSLAVIALYERHEQFFAEFDKEVRQRSRTQYQYFYGAFEEIDPIVTSFYDSFILYSTAVRKLVEKGGSPENITDGLQIVNQIKNMSLDSPLGYPINMDLNGDRSRIYSIKDLDLETGKFSDVLRIDYQEHQELWFGSFKWPGHVGLPPDEPLCGFGGDARACNISSAIGPAGLAGIILGVLIVMLAIAGTLFSGYNARKARYGVDPYWWRVRTDELQILSKKGLHAARSGGSLQDSRSVVTMDTGNTMMNSIGNQPDNVTLAMYDGNQIALTVLPSKVFKATPGLIAELNEIRTLTHPNLHRLIGICLDEQNFCEFLAQEACLKGSLEDVLENETIKLDWSFKFSLLRDLTEGMHYLHGSVIISHGLLSARNCLVDNRFMVKISNYGIRTFVPSVDFQPLEKSDEGRDFKLLLWRAPELLRQVMPPRGTQKGDVYGYGIIISQLILRCEPFDTQDSDNRARGYGGTDKEILLEVKQGSIPPLRPQVPRAACSPELYQLMERCWSEYPIERPSFVKITEIVRKIAGKASNNIIDHLLRRMEQYANSLEEQVAQKTEQFMEEKRRSEELLSQLLPRSIAAALTKGESIGPESFDSVTIYFSDIVGFTTICASICPMDVVNLLNNLYTLFDTVLEHYDVYKVETIGDAYMVASGLPIRNGNRHASEIAQVSLHIRNDIETFVIPSLPQQKLAVRIGLHSGPAVAGVVGLKMPRYCLFGDTVNTASRMESTGEAMKVQISDKTKELLDKVGGFLIRERGVIEVKGKGSMTTFWLIGRVAE